MELREEFASITLSVRRHTHLPVRVRSPRQVRIAGHSPGRYLQPLTSGRLSCCRTQRQTAQRAGLTASEKLESSERQPRPACLMPLALRSKTFRRVPAADRTLDALPDSGLLFHRQVWLRSQFLSVKGKTTFSSGVTEPHCHMRRHRGLVTPIRLGS